MEQSESGNGIDICIPCLNGEHVIKRTILSCVANKAKFNVVVGLNSCTDKTEEKILELGLQNVSIYKFKDRVGMGENWVRTLKLSQAKLVKLLPAGDELTEGALDNQQNLLSNVTCGNVAFVSSSKCINHPNKLIQYVINNALAGNKKILKIDLENILDDIKNRPRNLFGEPGCILFKGDLLRKVINSKHSSDNFLRNAMSYPYIVDMALYLEILNYDKQYSSVLLDSFIACTFEVTKNSGTWKLRSQQVSDLIDYLNSIGVKPTRKSKYYAFLNAIARSTVYAFA